MTSPERSALQLAEHWLSIERPDRALEALAGLHGDEALSPRAFFVRVTALHDLERHGEAVAAAQAAIERVGVHPHLLALQGSSRRALGQHQAAEEAFLAGLAQEPTDTLLLCWYARLCLEVGQVDKAQKLIDRAASHDPESGLVSSGRALIAYVRGQDAQMLRESREGLRNAPDDAAAHALYGMAAANRAQYSAANRSLSRAVADNPGDRDLVDAAREVRAANHPLMRPLWPIHRFGPMQVWFGMIVVIFALRGVGLSVVAGIVGLCWILYCVYSWVIPPIVRRLARRGR